MLNTAFWPDNPPFYDPNHGSGVLSRGLSGAGVSADGTAVAAGGDSQGAYRAQALSAGCASAQCDPGRTAGRWDIYRILRDRFIKKPKKPGFLVGNRGGQVCAALSCGADTESGEPHHAGSERDYVGMPRALIDLRFTEQDVQSVIDSHARLDKALRANGVGTAGVSLSPGGLPERVYAQAADGSPGGDHAHGRRSAAKRRGCEP